MLLPLHQTIKGFYVYLLSSFYIGVQSFGKSTGPFSVYIPQEGVVVFISRAIIIVTFKK